MYEIMEMKKEFLFRLDAYEKFFKKSQKIKSPNFQGFF